MLRTRLIAEEVIGSRLMTGGGNTELNHELRVKLCRYTWYVDGMVTEARIATTLFVPTRSNSMRYWQKNARKRKFYVGTPSVDGCLVALVAWTKCQD